MPELEKVQCSNKKRHIEGQEKLQRGAISTTQTSHFMNTKRAIKPCVCSTGLSEDEPGLEMATKASSNAQQLSQVA